MFTEKMEQYVVDTNESLKAFIRTFAPIPAPSHNEDRRVEFLTGWLKEQGVLNVHVDEAKNVIWSINDTGSNDLTVFMAHTDVVFPDTTPLPFVIDGDVYRCPGITDDTSPLSVLLYSAMYFFKNGCAPKTGILIIANSCEEGLGNLKGSRCIVDTYGDRIKHFYTVESSPKRIVNQAVGSHRYRVTVKTEGGHSYSKFGNRNAIRCLAQMIDTFYSVKVPEKPGTKTTYNVGMISGGTSVNTICQEASMLFEYRSTDFECLQKMKEMFDSVIAAYRTMGITVDVELLGERPCANVDPVAEQALCDLVADAIREIFGIEGTYGSSSTDANYPLSKGIPAVCVGSVEPHLCHTREEFLETKDLPDAMRIVMRLLAYYFE